MASSLNNKNRRHCFKNRTKSLVFAKKSADLIEPASGDSIQSLPASSAEIGISRMHRSASAAGVGALGIGLWTSFARRAGQNHHQRRHRQRDQQRPIRIVQCSKKVHHERLPPPPLYPARWWKDAMNRP